MNLRLLIGALTLVGACTLPLKAGVLTFTFTETAGTASVTATLSGALNQTNYTAGASSPLFTQVLPGGTVQVIGINVSGSDPTRWDVATGVAVTLPGGTGAFGTGSGATGSDGTTPFGNVGFMNLNGALTLYLPKNNGGNTAFDFNTTSFTNSASFFPGQGLSALGLTPNTSFDFLIGSGATQDTIKVVIPGGASSVPDNGRSVAGLGLALAGLHLLRRRMPGALQR